MALVIPLAAKSKKESKKKSHEFKVINYEGVRKGDLNADGVKGCFGSCDILAHALKEGKIDTQIRISSPYMVECEGYGTKVNCPKCVQDLVTVIIETMFKNNSEVEDCSSFFNPDSFFIGVFDSPDNDGFVLDTYMGDCEMISMVFEEKSDGVYAFLPKSSCSPYNDSLPKELEEAIFDFVAWCTKKASLLKLHAIIYQAYGERDGSPVKDVLKKPLYMGYCSLEDGIYWEEGNDRPSYDEFAMCLIQHING